MARPMANRRRAATADRALGGRRGAVTVASILSMAVACSSDAGTSTPSTDASAPLSLDTPAALATETTSGDVRLWVRSPSDEELDAPVEGVLVWDEDAGCFLLERNALRYGVVWPSGATADPSGPAVLTGEGELLDVGEYVTGSGGYLQVADALGMPPACAPAAEVAVFNAESALTTRP